MTHAITRAVLAAATCALTLAACDREDMQRADRAGAEVGIAGSIRSATSN